MKPLPSLLFVLAVACHSREREEAIKLAQYKVQGEVLYAKHCSNCHQKEGQGLARLYPPLENSPYLRDSLQRAICIVRYGMRGEITVNGVVFNQPMPGVPTLTDLEVAEILTFVGNSWGNETGLVDVTAATSVLNRCD